MRNTLWNKTNEEGKKMRIVFQGLIVALQAIGGAAGNVISVHNVVSAAVVGFMEKEGIVIRRTALVFFYYCLIPSAAGTIFLYHSIRGGMFYAGIIIFIAWVAFVAYMLATNNARLEKNRKCACCVS
jgi:lactate permease